MSGSLVITVCIGVTIFVDCKTLVFKLLMIVVGKFSSGSMYRCDNFFLLKQISFSAINDSCREV